MNATPTGQRNKRPHTVYRPNQGDTGLHILFSLEAIQNDLKTKESGRPVFDDVEFIEIRIPGDDKTIIKTVVTDEYRERFPDEYDMFVANEAVSETGTPLEHWSALTKSQVASLKATGFMKVEDLVNASDANIASIMGGQDIRTKAKAFLDAAHDSALVEKQASEINGLREMIAALQAESARVAAAVAAQDKKTK